MKKSTLTFSLALGFAVMSYIAFYSCSEGETSEAKSENLTTYYQPDYQEIYEIVNQITCNNKDLPDWIVAIGKWIKAHTGKGQQYVNGQPTCFGNYQCGPCPGFCLYSIPPKRYIYGYPNGDNGELETVSSTDYSLGLRAAKFSIVENRITQEERIMITLTDDIMDFTFEDYVYFDVNVFLPDTFVSLFNVTSIELKSGAYPIIWDGGVGYSIIESVITR